jgi:hypothetical protein
MACTEGRPYFAFGWFTLFLQHSVPTCEGIVACIEVGAYVVRFNIIVTVVVDFHTETKSCVVCEGVWDGEEESGTKKYA